jgi:hypothetical protein
MVFVSVLLMPLLTLGLFGLVSLGEWALMRRRFTYMAAENLL